MPRVAYAPPGGPKRAADAIACSSGRLRSLSESSFTWGQRSSQSARPEITASACAGRRAHAAQARTTRQKSRRIIPLLDHQPVLADIALEGIAPAGARTVP